MSRLAIFAFLFAGYWMGQARGQSGAPTFTFTPTHGNKIVKGHFSPDGPLSFIDEFEGKSYSVDVSKVERIVLSPRKGSDNTKCGAAPMVVITFSDGTRQRGCFAPVPLGFVGSTAISSVNNTTGKFVRDKR